MLELTLLSVVVFFNCISSEETVASGTHLCIVSVYRDVVFFCAAQIVCHLYREHPSQSAFAFDGNRQHVPALGR